MSSTPTPEIQLTIDGKQVSVPAGTTIFDAARMNGIPIPTLCHQQNENPVGVCRVCVVDVGQRVYAASCIRQAEAGHEGEDRRPSRCKRARHTLVELLMSDHPAPCARQQHSGDCELERSGGSCRDHRAALPAPHHAAREGRFLGGHRGGPRVLHPVRPLHSRLRRHPAQLGAGPPRQGISGRHRLRSTICRWASRRAFPAASAWCRAPPARSPTSALSERELGEGDVLDPAELLHLPIFKNVSGTFLELNQKAVVKRRFRAGRDHLPRRRVRLHRFLHSGRQSGGLSLQPDRARQDAGQQQRILQPAEKHAVAARGGQRAAKNPTGRSSRLMPRSICPTTTRSPNWDPATCSAR